MAAKKRAKKKAAKKRAAKPRVAEVEAITPDEEKLELELEVGTSDIVAIGVAEYENNLRHQINESKKAWANAKKELKAAEENRAKKIEAALRKEYGKGVTILTRALAALGSKEPAKLEEGALRDNNETIFSRVRIGDWRFNLAKIEAGPEIAKSIARVEDAAKDVEDKRKHLHALQGELNNIGYAERQIKAQVSAAALKGSKRGKQLMRAIGSAKFVPQLPG